MSLFAYKRAIALRDLDEPFDSLIMAAMLQADDLNGAALRHAFPHLWDELGVRYHAPGGMTPDEAARHEAANRAHEDKMRSAILAAIEAQIGPVGT